MQLKELLEKILDDDSDMKDLNLSAKEVERQESMRRQSLRLSMAGTPFDVPIGSSGMPGAELQSQMSMLGSTPLSPNAPSVASDDLEDDDVAVVEQLLESYFMQVDNSWNKLQTLTEYIDDTEDFINM